MKLPNSSLVYFPSRSLELDSRMTVQIRAPCQPLPRRPCPWIRTQKMPSRKVLVGSSSEMLTSQDRRRPVTERHPTLTGSQPSLPPGVAAGHPRSSTRRNIITPRPQRNKHNPPAKEHRRTWCPHQALAFSTGLDVSLSFRRRSAHYNTQQQGSVVDQQASMVLGVPKDPGAVIRHRARTYPPRNGGGRNTNNSFRPSALRMLMTSRSFHQRMMKLTTIVVLLWERWRKDQNQTNDYSSFSVP